jgi:hypothetical protein
MASAQSTTASGDTGAVPAELEGVWHGEAAPGDEVDLTLRGTSYFIARGAATGNGAVSFDGDIVRFHGSNLCDGMGTYRWSIERDTLTLAVTEEGDECDGRLPALDGIAFER